MENKDASGPSCQTTTANSTEKGFVQPTGQHMFTLLSDRTQKTGKSPILSDENKTVISTQSIIKTITN